MENNSRQENSLESFDIKYIDRSQVVDNNSEDSSENKIIKQNILIGDREFNFPLSNKDASSIAENFGHNSDIKSLYEDLGKALSMAERNFINHFRNYNGLRFPDMFSKFSKKQKFTVNDCQQILKEVVKALETNSQISNPEYFLRSIGYFDDDKISPDSLENLVYYYCKDLVNDSHDEKVSYQYHIAETNALIAIYDGEVYILDRSSKEPFEDWVNIEKLKSNISNNSAEATFITRSTNVIPNTRSNWTAEKFSKLSEQKQAFVDFAGSVLFPDINDIKRRRLVLESFQENPSKVPSSLVRHLVSDDKNTEACFEKYIIANKLGNEGLSTLNLCGYKSPYKPITINLSDIDVSLGQQTSANNLLKQGHFVPFEITLQNEHPFYMAIKKEDDHLLIFVGDSTNGDGAFYGKVADKILTCLNINQKDTKVIIRKEFLVENKNDNKNEGIWDDANHMNKIQSAAILKSTIEGYCKQPEDYKNKRSFSDKTFYFGGKKDIYTEEQFYGCLANMDKELALQKPEVLNPENSNKKIPSTTVRHTTFDPIISKSNEKEEAHIVKDIVSYLNSKFRDDESKYKQIHFLCKTDNSSGCNKYCLYGNSEYNGKTTDVRNIPSDKLYVSNAADSGKFITNLSKNKALIESGLSLKAGNAGRGFSAQEISISFRTDADLVKIKKELGEQFLKSQTKSDTRGN